MVSKMAEKVLRKPLHEMPMGVGAIQLTNG